MDKQIPNCILLSYPRCGNTWTRCIIELLSNQPTFPNEIIFRNKIKLHFDENIPYLIHKEHSLSDPFNERRTAVIEDAEVYHKCKLLFILRDYKELLIRQKSSINDFLYNKNLEPHKFNYLNNLYEFDKWPADKKLLIYYEDLILNPFDTFRKILNFLSINVDEKCWDDFEENYEYYQKMSFDNYSETQNQGILPRVKNKDIHYHKKKLTKRKKEEMDNLIISKHSELYDKYLQKYRESTDE